MRRARSWKRWAWVALPLLLVITFWPAVTPREIFYFGDIYRHFYPLRMAYARAMAEGRLPLWTSSLVAGYPLLAEGQIGALYPPNILLCALLPVEVALNVSILAHFLLAGVGMYLFCRSLTLHRGPSLTGGIVFMMGGFLVAHLNHISILSVAAWLPYLMLAGRHTLDVYAPTRGSNRKQPSRSRRVTWTIVLALLVAIQFLAGHPQISLLNILLLGAYVLHESASIGKSHLPGANPRGCVELLRRLRLVWPVGLALLMGTAIAAPQLLPSYELTGLSQRAGGLEGDFFTSFSLHPFYLATLLAPFVRGNPYPDTSVELIGYVGALPLALALVAPIINRRRTRGEEHPTRFWVILALLALFLAFGRWNPLYRYLAYVPILNLFRVPARFIYFFAYGCSVLAAIGLEGLGARARAQESPGRPDYVALGVFVSGLSGAAIIVARTSSVDELIRLWYYLPVLFAFLSSSLLLLGWRGRLRRSTLVALALLLVMVDLYAFNSVYGVTYNDTMPRQHFRQPPQVLEYLAQDTDTYRVYTHEEILPVLSVMRESLYPNLSLLHDVQSANGYLPLFPNRYRTYMDGLTARRLDLLNVRYFMIPQLLPVDERTELYDLEDPFAPTLVGRAVHIPAMRIASITIESYMSHSVDIAHGELVAQVWLVDTEGNATLLPLRAGYDTAEWAYERTDVLQHIQHAKAPVTRSWPAWSGFPPEPHVGNTYAVTYPLREITKADAHSDEQTDYPLIEEILIDPKVPIAYLRVERILLEDDQGQVHLLSHLIGEGDHTLVYRSQDVAIYRVHDHLPRAWLVHQARVIPDDEELLAALDGEDFDPWQEVLLSTGKPLDSASYPEGDRVSLCEYQDQRVVMEVSTNSQAYLVLADTFYPGWEVRVRTNNSEASTEEKSIIQRANYLFRAVALPPGEHVVEFCYRPRSFHLGLLISGTALALVVGFLIWTATVSNTTSEACRPQKT